MWGGDHIGVDHVLDVGRWPWWCGPCIGCAEVTIAGRTIYWVWGGGHSGMDHVLGVGRWP